MKRNPHPKLIKLWLPCMVLFAPAMLFGQVAGEESIIKTACFQSKRIKPAAQNAPDPQIPEGSGLVAWNGRLFTHNDSGLPRLFALDSTDGTILKTYDLPGVRNLDWEDMGQDKNFLYVGDFGNNSGARDRLRIFRIDKAALLKDKIVLDSIAFEWPQSNESGQMQKVNFDCEAMAVIRDTVFLFTKEWKSRRQSRIFKIPARPGNHIAQYVATLKTRMLVTGASYHEAQNRLVLCGYSLLLTPRLLVLPLPASGSFKDIREGTKVRIRRRLRQTEGITTFNGTDYYVISEGTDLGLWKNKAMVFGVRL